MMLAQLQLRLLEAFNKESANLKVTTVTTFNTIGEELITEKYEHSNVIATHRDSIKTHYELLDKMAVQRLPVLQDDLSRETYKQQVRLQHKEYNRRFEILAKQWIEPKEAYLQTFLEIHSVEDANTQLR